MKLLPILFVTVATLCTFRVALAPPPSPSLYEDYFTQVHAVAYNSFPGHQRFPALIRWLHQNLQGSLTRSLQADPAELAMTLRQRHMDARQTVRFPESLDQNVALLNYDWAHGKLYYARKQLLDMLVGWMDGHNTVHDERRAYATMQALEHTYVLFHRRHSFIPHGTPPSL